MGRMQGIANFGAVLAAILFLQTGFFEPSQRFGQLAATASNSIPWLSVPSPQPAGVAGAQEQEPSGAEHVVILVMDGARYDHTFGDPERRYVPEMAENLAPRGLLMTNFANLGHTVTVSGHATMATGWEEQVYGEEQGHFSHQTLFERARRELGFRAEDAWLVLDKNKLGMMFDRSIGQHEYRPSIWARDTDDAAVAGQVWSVLSEHRPRLLLANFPSVDRNAHAGNWDGYLSAIRRFDQLAVETWRRIQADPVLVDRTILVITNDHGRRYDNWTEHGDDSEGSRHIMLLAVGPGIAPGSVSDVPGSLADLAVSAGQVLGLEPLQGGGRPLTRLVSDPAVKQRAAFKALEHAR